MPEAKRECENRELGTGAKAVPWATPGANPVYQLFTASAAPEGGRVQREAGSGIRQKQRLQGELSVQRPIRITHHPSNNPHALPVERGSRARDRTHVCA